MSLKCSVSAALHVSWAHTIVFAVKDFSLSLPLSTHVFYYLYSNLWNPTIQHKEEKKSVLCRNWKATNDNPGYSGCRVELTTFDTTAISTKTVCFKMLWSCNSQTEYVIRASQTGESSSQAILHTET